MKKVIKINESDIERLVNKILSEEGEFKRSDLKPAIATITNTGKQKLVIVNRSGDVEAVGPDASVLKGMSRDNICNMVDRLVADMFHLEEEMLNELDKGDFKDIKVINFCNNQKNESKELIGGFISESELEKMVGWVINEEEEDDNPCWDGYEMVGMKKKNGKEVPNCVPIKEDVNWDEVGKKLEKAFGPDFVDMDFEDYKEKLTEVITEAEGPSPTEFPFNLTGRDMGDKEYDSGEDTVVWTKGEEPSSYDKKDILDRAAKLIHNVAGINILSLGIRGAVLGSGGLCDKIPLFGFPTSVGWIAGIVASMILSKLSHYYFKKKHEFFKKRRKGNVTEAEKRGDCKNRQLNKPWLTPDGPKKRSVCVKNGSGNVVKVNFGDPNMKIKKSDPERRKSFRARHNCDNPGPKWKARYWSCKHW
jgi:hypothetical protein